MSSQDRKTSLFIEQCAGYLQDATYIYNVEDMFFSPDRSRILPPLDQGNANMTTSILGAKLGLSSQVAS
jgi:hypothetical protein